MQTEPARGELRVVRRAPSNLRRKLTRYKPLDELFVQHSGIASTRELREALGDWPDMIPTLRTYGRIIPLRQGWYAAPWLPEDARLAWRFGGPLACISALEHHGIRQKPLDVPWGMAAARPLHICVTTSTPHIREPWMLVERVGIPLPHAPIVHWSTRDWSSGDRRAVSIPVATAHARRCRAAQQT